MTLIAATFFLDLILFVAVFLLIRLRHPWSGRMTVWLIAAASALQGTPCPSRS